MKIPYPCCTNLPTAGIPLRHEDNFYPYGFPSNYFSPC